MVDVASVDFLLLYAGHRETRAWVALMDLTGAQQCKQISPAVRR